MKPIALSVQLFIIGLVVSSSACAEATSITPSVTASIVPSVVSTSTPTPTSTSTLTNTPPPSPTPTETLPCQVNWCVKEGDFWLQRPIQPPDNDQFNPQYAYGSTQFGTREPHPGVDIANAVGTPVTAAADGIVVVAGDDKSTLYGPAPDFYGNLVILQHQLPQSDQPVFTLYGHLSKIDVSVGDHVSAGQVIGQVGVTGYAIGAHLHFEVRIGSYDFKSIRNPALYLKPLVSTSGEPYGLVVGRIADTSGQAVRVNLTIQQLDQNNQRINQFFPEIYDPSTPSDPAWNETFSLADLQAGHYRLVFEYEYKLYDLSFEVLPGKVTVISMTVPTR
ncbi:MAG TPA: M23 family metallopeptidase [Longilinea sp.]|nr:M23 family metallopeptidase [Longilinea sp.]